jgi:hypothetical protein
MEKHISLVAALHIGFGALGVLFAAIVFVAVVGGGLLSGDPEAITITSLVGTVVGAFIFIVSIPGVIGGIGLLKRKNWARILVLIISCLDLLNIPIGTALGIFSIWVLLHDDVAPLFAPAAK